MIKLQDFAKECGVTDRAIQKHLKNHESQLEGHFQRRGKNGTWLDPTAQEYIRSLMIQQPVVVGDSDVFRKVEELQAEMLRLHRKLEEAQDALLNAKGTQALLEASERRTEALEADLEVAKADLDKFEPLAFGLWRKKR